jgi:subtilisin family serine protease
MKSCVFSFDETKAEEIKQLALGQDYIDWGLHTIMAPVAWKTTKGNGVKVAVLDTGVDQTHPDLEANIAAVVDFTGSPSGTNDIQGHGTHCAGIIAGTDTGTGIVGVAPQVKLYCGKVLGDNGTGSIENIVKGLQWAIQENVDVISMSLGTTQQPPEKLHESILQAITKGITIVAATGNNNGPVGWPALYDEVIAVSALNEDYDRADFSNYGIKNEIIAPGVDILSTYKNHTYARLSGTSMATPIISASAALYISRFKELNDQRPSVQQIHTALDRATVDLGGAGKDEYYGFGLINLAKLFKN